MPETIAGLFIEIGIGEATSAVLADVVIGSALGTGVSALTGGNIGLGALTGGITGGFIGLGPTIGAELGINSTLATVASGAVGGAIGGAVTGQDPGRGALFGGAGGLLASSLGGASSGAAKAPGIEGGTGASPVGGVASTTATTLGGTPDIAANLAMGSSGAGASSLAASPLGSVAAAPIEGITVAAPAGISGAGVAGGSALSTAGMPGHGTFGQSPSTPDLSGGTDASKLDLATGLSSYDPFAQNSGSASGAATGSTGLPSDLHMGSGSIDVGPSLRVSDAAPSAHSGVTNALDKSGDWLKKNPVAGVAGLGLLTQMANQPHLPDNSAILNTLKARADSLGQNGALLSSYLNTGNLPAGVMSAVTNASHSAKATIRSRFAQLGMSGSTSEATALSQVDEETSSRVFEIADHLLQTGLKETGMSADIYRTILNDVNANHSEMSGAIANFAAAIAGGGRAQNVGAG